MFIDIPYTRPEISPSYRPHWPKLELATVMRDCLMSVVPSRRLTGDYSRPKTDVNDADRRAITADIRRAYDDLVRQSCDQNRFCSPFVAWLRLIGRDGEVLYTTAPGLLTSDEPTRFVEENTVDCPGGRDLNPIHFWVYPFDIYVNIMFDDIPEDMAAAVGRIEILAGDPFDPFDAEGLARIFTLPSAKRVPTFYIEMPGVDNAVVSAKKNYDQETFERMLAHAEATRHIISVIDNPLHPGDTLSILVPLTLRNAKGRVVARYDHNHKASRVVARYDQNYSSHNSYNSYPITPITPITLISPISPITLISPIPSGGRSHSPPDKSAPSDSSDPP